MYTAHTVYATMTTVDQVDDKSFKLGYNFIFHYPMDEILLHCLQAHIRQIFLVQLQRNLTYTCKSKLNL